MTLEQDVVCQNHIFIDEQSNGNIYEPIKQSGLPDLFPGLPNVYHICEFGDNVSSNLKIVQFQKLNMLSCIEFNSKKH